MSRTVKKLESKLGVTLLNRTTRQISLTHEGEHYFRRVQSILREMATAENEILDNQLNPKGLLRIDASTPVVLHILAPLIAEFRQRYPLVTLSLVSSETFINLIERKVDIAIRVGTLQDSTLRARKLMTSYRHILASPAYLQQHETPRTVVDLQHHVCLGFNDLPTFNRWPLTDSDGQLYEIKSDITSNNGETQRRLCLEGNGIACLSDFMVQQDLQRGDLIPVLAEHTLRVAMPINAVYYSDQAVSNRLRCFIDFINERLSPAIQTK